MLIRIKNELITSSIITGFLILLILFVPSIPAWAILGLSALVFLTICMLIAAAFSERVGLKTNIRTALVIGAGLVVGCVIHANLDYYHWDVAEGPLVIWCGVFIAAASAAAWYQRYRFSTAGLLGRNSCPTLSSQNGRISAKVALAILSVTIILSLGGMGYAVFRPDPIDPYTDLSLLDKNGETVDYPSLGTTGVESQVMLRVVNAEHQRQLYRILVIQAGIIIGQIDPIALEDKQQWQQGVTFIPALTGKNQEIIFELYRQEDLLPYHSLHLWMDVLEGPPTFDFPVRNDSVNWPVVVASWDQIEGMGIKSIKVNNNASIVTTNGAVFEVDLDTWMVRISQRIGTERAVGILRLDPEWTAELGAPRVVDNFECVWGGDQPGSPEMRIAGDSTIKLTNIRKAFVKLAFTPEFTKLGDDNDGLVAMDGTGGISIIPPEYPFDQTITASFEEGVWSLTTDEPIDFLFIGVSPPRAYNWERSYLTVLHYSSHVQRYPTDEQIKEYSTFADVLEFHQWVWENRYDQIVWEDMPEYMWPYREKVPEIPGYIDLSWLPQDEKWIPDNDAEFRRVIATVHSLGMKVVPYIGSYFGSRRGTSLESQLAEIQRLKDVYDIDGIYVDGLCYQQPEEGYFIARELRKMFGDEGWLTFHNTHLGYFFPVLQSYMDFIVTSEHLPFDRWYSTTYNISNAIGARWAEIPIDVDDGWPYLKDLVDDGIAYNNRFIFMTGQQGQWREWRLYFTPAEMDYIKPYYFNLLGRLRDLGYEAFLATLPVPPPEGPAG